MSQNEKEEKKEIVQEKKASLPVQFTILSQNGLQTFDFYEDSSEIKCIAESKL